MKRAKIRCPYCGANATLHPASYVHKESAKPGQMLYVCDRYPACDTYVGAHRRTQLPMGTLADRSLRHKRMEAHRSFNWMWQSGTMTKAQAYRWLQVQLGLDNRQTHIAQFGPYACDQVIQICKQARKNIRTPV